MPFKSSVRHLRKNGMVEYVMMEPVFFTLIGYLCGSILFAKVFGKIFRKSDMLAYSKDNNPGTANAYQYGGFWCGTFTLWGDLLKGFLPIYLLTLRTPISQMGLGYALALAAPVIGHAFPIFSRLHGGKGVAVTFGCLLGLYPYGLPLFLFAGSFIFFSVILRITPHFYRTIFAYIGTFLSLLLFRAESIVCIGFFMIAVTVCFRLHLSKEEREEMKVRLVWMH